MDEIPEQDLIITHKNKDYNKWGYANIGTLTFKNIVGEEITITLDELRRAFIKSSETVCEGEPANVGNEPETLRISCFGPHQVRVIENGVPQEFVKAVSFKWENKVGSEVTFTKIPFRPKRR